MTSHQDPAPPESPVGPLGGRVLRGIGWKAASAATVQVTRVATMVLLARVLSPAEFGIAAVVLVFSGLALIFTDLALGSALVQRKDITEADSSTVFWTSAGIGAVFVGVGVALSWPLAAFYGEPEVQPLLAVFSLTFLLNGLSTTQSTLLARALAFRALELRIMIATAAGAVVAVALALSGAGAWALIGQALTTTAMSTVLLWTFSTWRPAFVYSLASLRRLGAFGLGIFGSRLVWFANKNTDTVLIGRFLGSNALGAYAIAFNLMLFPISRIAQPIGNVMFPALSRVQGEPKRLSRGWLRASKAVAAIALPAMLGMMVVAPEFVRVVLGEQWVEAVPVIQVLAWVGALQALQQIGASALEARGRAGTLLGFTLLAFAANVGAFVVGLPFGIVGVATAYAVSTTLVFAPFIVVCARTAYSSLGGYLRAIGPLLLAACLMAVAAAGARIGLRAVGAGDVLTLLGTVAVGALVYAAAARVVEPRLVVEIRDRLRRRRSRVVSDEESADV